MNCSSERNQLNELLNKTPVGAYTTYLTDEVVYHMTMDLFFKDQQVDLNQPIQIIRQSIPAYPLSQLDSFFSIQEQTQLLRILSRFHQKFA